MIVLVGVVEMDARRKAVRDTIAANSERFRSAVDSLPREPTPEQVWATRARLGEIAHRSSSR
ncbi:hypothetical protein [Streptomyces flavofungini]|uniref:hypothetical protein n=1 Tax=Streptomyces flavofungini TaxID=68200 RepID=UPI0025B080E4|nr:hypothetical protein [Streptomyces flavofungini]WJV45786.1 hypothetical protein QUY26_09705 [Streptomyces flavofungini]